MIGKGNIAIDRKMRKSFNRRLDIDEFITDDTNRKVWVIHIPKHLPKRPVFAHNKAWQRIEDSLVEMTAERMSAILDEPIFAKQIGRHKL